MKKMIILPPHNSDTPSPKLIVWDTFIIPKANSSSLNETRTKRRITSPLNARSKNGGSFIFIP